MNILIVRLSSLGDVILTTPVIRCIKKQLKAKLIFVTKDPYTGALAFNPYIDAIYSNNQKAVVQKIHFDIIIDLQNNFRSRQFIAGLKGRVISLRKDHIAKWAFLKFRVNLFKYSHVVEKYFSTVAHLDIVNDGEGLDYFGGESQQDKRLSGEKRIVSIVLGGTYITKRIPLKLIVDLLKISNFELHLLGGNDVNLDFYPDLKQYRYNHVGKLSIEESIRIIMKSELIVTGDTGLMHVAAALDKPIVVVWGSTSEDFGFYPYYAHNSNKTYRSVQIEDLSCRPCSKYGRTKCPKRHMDCLNKISPNTLLLTINETLASNSI